MPLRDWLSLAIIAVGVALPFVLTIACNRWALRLSAHEWNAGDCTCGERWAYIGSKWEGWCQMDYFRCASCGSSLKLQERHSDEMQCLNVAPERIRFNASGLSRRESIARLQ